MIKWVIKLRNEIAIKLLVYRTFDTLIHNRTYTKISIILPNSNNNDGLDKLIEIIQEIKDQQNHIYELMYFT